ncbi:MAG: four helix bundle protein [Burkholderiales bacterium]
MRRKHHDLVAWKVSVELVTELYQLTETFSANEAYGLISQSRRAAVSVPSNIAKGAARTSKREFAHYLSMARGSLSEIDTQLVISKQLGFIHDDEQLQQKMTRVFGLIGGLLKSTRAAD